ncbi:MULTISPECIES: DUF481 domain-containing protein [Methylotenera]|uniref:DUF481 domain-containing protein n=1 Tax=Methylotenera TaxID=359407 RepID=UPI000365D597|nr:MULTISPECIES: DUF481 domain-containing protein [Methylotenera]
MRLAKPLFPIILITSLFSFSVSADEVRLKNGDVITGTIIKKETDKLVFNTNYAGDISIAWSEISSLNTKEPVQVYLTDETVFTGVIGASQSGRAKIVIANSDAQTDIDLNQLNYINPNPLVSGVGVVWSGNINLGGAITQGNTDTSLVRADGETIARTKYNRFTVGGVVNRAKSNNVDTEYNSRGYAKYDKFLTKKWYLYTNASLENDRFRDINLRSTAGVGNGYQLYEQDDLNLAIEGGINYINVDYDVARDESYASGRWALRYDQKPMSGDVQFFHQHEILFGLEKTANTLIFSKTGLRVPIAKNLNASAQINLDYNSRPVEDRKELDKTLLFSLGYGW